MAELVALLFGATIIAIFSHQRFKRVSYEGGERFRRLIDLLTPDKLRARRVVFRAHLFYTASLLIVYLTLCAYTELIPQLGGDTLGEAIGATTVPESQAPPEPIEESLRTGFAPTEEPPPAFWAKALGRSPAQVGANEEFRLGIPPSVSMAVALMIIGLTSSFPFLEGVDVWLRSTAHRLAGIPTWVINNAEALRSRSPEFGLFKNDGSLEKDSQTFLIPMSDVDRMKKYRDKSKVAGFPEEDDFWNDLQLIFAVSAWILDRRVPLNTLGQREKFAELEESLRARKKALELAADGLARKPNPAAADRAVWEQVAQDADALANDLCVLIALFVEHDFIVARALSDELANESDREAPQGNGSAKRLRISQGTLAQQKLLDLTEQLRTDLDRPEKRREMANVTLFWASAVTLLFVLFWSLLPAAWEVQLQRGEPRGAYWRLVNYEFTAFAVYIVPLLVGLGIRESRWESALKWENLSHRHHWTRIVPQVFAVILLGAFASLLLLVSVVVWQAGLYNENRFDSWKDVPALINLVRRGFEYNGPQALRGAILAVLVLWLLDARQGAVRGDASVVAGRAQAEEGRHVEKQRTQGTAGSANKGNAGSKTGANRHHKPWTKGISFLWALCGGIIMFCVGIATRYLTYLGSSPTVNSERRPFDSIDAGLALYAGVFSFLLAYLILFCVSEALFDRSASFRRDRAFRDQRTRTDDFAGDADLTPEGST